MVLTRRRSPIPANWSLQNYLAQHKQRIEERLKALPRFTDKPTTALAACRYALETKGKRFRPLLAIAAADIYRQGNEPAILDAGVAIECVHTASLLLDDLPCMDDASLRRGRETTHRRFGEDQAILAAMTLIAEGSALLAGPRSSGKTALSRQLEAVELLNLSISLEGLCGGQSDDLRNQKDLSLQDLEFIHAKKTGALFIATVEIPAVLCGAPQKERHCLKSYAKNLGLAFQIKDDLLDWESSEQTGKDSVKSMDKTTFVSLVGARQCEELHEKLMDAALKNLEPLGKAAFHLCELTRVIRERAF